MGRGRGKGKKQPVSAARDDTGTGSGEDGKFPVRRRGRPQKTLKDNIQEEYEVEKIEEDDEIEDSKNSSLSKNSKTLHVMENGRKRKRCSPVKENADLVKDENAKTNSTDVIKSYRQNGSRRKNKPRRAAEVGVECK